MQKRRSEEGICIFFFFNKENENEMKRAELRTESKSFIHSNPSFKSFLKHEKHSLRYATLDICVHTYKYSQDGWMDAWMESRIQ